MNQPVARIFDGGGWGGGGGCIPKEPGSNNCHASAEGTRLLGKSGGSLRSLNCWKCIEIVNSTITTLFFYHLEKIL